MWRWLQNKIVINEYYRYCARVVVVCIAFHLLFFLILFFGGRPCQQMPWTVLSDKNIRSVPIVYMPLQRKVAGALQRIKQSQSKKVQRAPQKKKVKLPAKKTAPKLQTKQTAEKKESVSPKKSTETKKQPPKIHQTEQPKKPEPAPVAEQNASETADPIAVGRDDLLALRTMEALQIAVSSAWHPPAGLQKKLATVVAITLDANGGVKTYEITQRSGVLVYDMSVRRAISQIVFPKQFWGKTVTINFQQFDEEG